jgi:hypothetical protein
LHIEEKTGTLTHPGSLRTGQEVHVRVGSEDLGRGRIDDMTDGGDTVWVFFGGATPRRLFIDEDAAEYRVLPSGR